MTKSEPIRIVNRVSYNLFIDDRRDPPDDGREWMLARTAPEAIAIVDGCGMPRRIAFDHDLGPLPDGTIHDIKMFLRWFENYILDHRPNLDQFVYTVHSDNPPGAADIRVWMDGILQHARGGY